MTASRHNTAKRSRRSGGAAGLPPQPQRTLQLERRNSFSNRPAALLLLAAAVTLIIIAAHWPVLSAQALAFDDGEFLTRNPLVQDPSMASAKRFVTEVLEPSTVHGYYIPLTMISLMLDHAAGGRPDDLRQFHRTNLVLHVITTIGVAMLLHLLFGNAWAAALLGALYGVHPLAVEPVAWIAERKTVLATCFAVWALVLYVGYVRKTGRALYLVALSLTFLSLAAKPTAVTLPLLMLLLDYWPLRRLEPRRVFEKIPHFLLAAASAVITIVSNARTANLTLPTDASAAPLLLKIPHNLFFYAEKILWPADLTPYYPLPEPFALANPEVTIGVIATASAAALLLVSLRWTHAVACGAAFCLVALLPTLGIIGYSWINVSDKYLYFPMIGLLLPPAALLSWLKIRAEASPRSAAGMAVVLAVLLAAVPAAAVGTRRALSKWRDSETLYSYMIALAPRAGVLKYSLASTLLEQGRLEEALTNFRASATLSPGMPDVHIGEANALLRMGRTHEAISPLNRALQINPDSAIAHNSLGMALAALGALDEAAAHHQDAVRITPDYFDARINLGAVRLKQNRLSEAEEQFRIALEIDSRAPAALVNLGVVLKSQGKYDDAIGLYKQALEGDPTHPEIHRNIAIALQEQGKSAEAAHYFADALFFQGLALERAGDRAAAAALYAEVLKLVPDHADALNRLGQLR